MRASKAELALVDAEKNFKDFKTEVNGKHFAITLSYCCVVHFNDVINV